MKQLISKRVYAIILIVVLLITFIPNVSFADDSIEPDPSSDCYITCLHVNQPYKWQPYKDYPELSVTYSSDKPDVISIAEDGTVTVHKEGSATITATTPGNATYKASTFDSFIDVLAEADGLYLYEGDPHFYYQGCIYGPGELPLEVERNLCLTNPDLKIYLTDYLEPAKASIEDDTEATLTAILNYGANYYSKNFVFDGYGGSSEMAKTQWLELLRRHVGLCTPHASLFCYLMYLSNLTSMSVDSGEPQEDRAHTWCIIEHDGYYYNLEEYNFMHDIREKYATAPISLSNAAYFESTICSTHLVPFPTEGATMKANTKISDMGRDLTKECPVLLYEHLSDGSYRARFVTVKKGQIPTYSDGTPLQMTDLSYKNMENDPGTGKDGAHNQYNKSAYAVFSVANNMLYNDIAPLWEVDNSSASTNNNTNNNNTNNTNNSEVNVKVRPAKTKDSLIDMVDMGTVLLSTLSI